MSRTHIGIRPGDLIRSPDRATARWHTVVRVGRRRDGTRYIVIRRGRIWRALGMTQFQRLEWAALSALGFGLRRKRAAHDPLPPPGVTGTEAN